LKKIINYDSFSTFKSGGFAGSRRSCHINRKDSQGVSLSSKGLEHYVKYFSYHCSELKKLKAMLMSLAVILGAIILIIVMIAFFVGLITFFFSAIKDILTGKSDSWGDSLFGPF
jgi:hypothetical protein